MSKKQRSQVVNNLYAVAFAFAVVVAVAFALANLFLNITTYPTPRVTAWDTNSIGMTIMRFEVKKSALL